jgi:hypothetical protein
MGGFGIDHRLSGARIRVRSQNHRGVAAYHADEIFERWRALGYFGRRLLGDGLGSFGDGVQTLLALGFAFFFFQSLLANFAIGCKGAAVDNAK